MALTGLTNLQPLHIKTVGIGTFDNTVSIGGTLTYEDVTNVDSIGIVTARDDINIITDGKKLKIGAGADLQLHHTSNHSYIDDAGTGNLRLRSGTLEIQNLASSKTSAIFSSGGGQTLNFNDSTKFVTTNTGVVITGICTATSFSGDGSNLTGISAGVSVANQADNRLITATGTTDALNGESGLTYSSNTLDVTNAVKLPDDGTVHFGSADTAYVRGKDSSDGYLKLGTAGLERVRIDSSGRVGINRTPALAYSKLEVGGADNYPLINVEASGATGGMGIGGGALKFYYGTSERFTVSNTRIDAKEPLYLETAGSYIKSNQLLFNPSGAAYVDHGVTGQSINFRMSSSSSLDTTAMTINHNGHITRPNNPCASMTVDSNTVSGNYMRHSSVHTNIGNHYNTGTYIFTCPVAGLYYVSIMVMSNNSNTTMDLEFHINGSNSNNILVPYSAATGGQYNQAVGSTIVYCPANAQLRFKLNSGSIYGGRHSNMTFALFA